MIRAVGAVLVAGGGLWLGLSRASWHRRRVRTLRCALLALEELERELSASAPPMGRLLDALVELPGPLRDCFARCRAGLDELEEQPFAALWAETFRAAPLALTEAERERIAALGTVLGHYGPEDQSAALRSAREDLGRRLEQAEEERGQMERLDCVLGSAAGLLAVILLL